MFIPDLDLGSVKSVYLHDDGLNADWKHLFHTKESLTSQQWKRHDNSGTETLSNPVLKTTA